MRLFQTLQMLDADVTAPACKLHLAARNMIGEEPLDLYLAGEFDPWQTLQTQRNFERPLVVSLISLPEPDLWLFAGVHEASGSDRDEARGLHVYRLRRRASTDALDGRLVVRFKRPGRQSYLRAERWEDDLRVEELRARKHQIGDFPGHARTTLSKRHLDLVVEQEIPSWKAALGSVVGIYVIADTATGRLYVGSATAEDGGGIWARWCQYARTGHGGNKELRKLLAEEGAEYAQHFQFGVLEIADTHATRKDVFERESYWKRLLLTREHGLNGN